MSDFLEMPSKDLPTEYPILRFRSKVLVERQKKKFPTVFLTVAKEEIYLADL